MWSRAQKILWAALLLALPTQLAFHPWPDWSRVLGRNVDYLSPALYATDLLILLAIFLSARRPDRSSVRHFLFPLGILLALCAINIMGAQVWQVAAVQTGKWLLFAAWGWLLQKSRLSEKFIRSFLLGGVMYSVLLGLTQVLLQRSLGSVAWWLGERTFTVDTPGIARSTLGVLVGNELLNGQLFLRPYATFPHPNVFGGFCLTLYPLFLWTEGTRLSRTVTLWGRVLTTGGVLLSGSRSVWLIYLGVSLGFLLRRIIAKVCGRLPRLALSGILGVVLLGMSSIPLLTSIGESSALRKDLLIASGRMLATAPVMGIGMGNFIPFLPAHLESRQILFLQPVHNIYVLLLVELGLLGIVVIGLLFAVFSRPSGVAPVVPWRVALLILMLLGTLDHYPLTLQQGQLLLVLVLARTLAATHDAA